MKLTRVLAGYTIVEVMIVLAVTGGLFLSAMLLITGQQARTEFNQGVRNVESKIQDVMNDVSSGFYPNPSASNIRCEATLTGPDISPNASNTQGTNADCIYVGRAIEFSESDFMRIHSLVGLRLVAGSTTKEVATVVQTQPKTIAPTSSTDDTPDGTERFNLPAGMQLRWVRYAGSPPNIGSVAFIGELASYQAGSNLLQSQARKRINLVPVKDSQVTDSSFTTAGLLNAIKTKVDADGMPLDMNPDQGISVCMDSSINRHAIITVGGTARTLGTQTIIGIGGCPA